MIFLRFCRKYLGSIIVRKNIDLHQETTLRIIKKKQLFSNVMTTNWNANPKFFIVRRKKNSYLNFTLTSNQEKQT